MLLTRAALRSCRAIKSKFTRLPLSSSSAMSSTIMLTSTTSRTHFGQSKMMLKPVSAPVRKFGAQPVHTAAAASASSASTSLASARASRTHLIRDLSDAVDEDVVVQGWLHAVRVLGKIGFLTIRDGTGDVQCVLPRPKAEEGDAALVMFEEWNNVPLQSVVTVRGRIQKRPAKDVREEDVTGTVELIVEEAHVLNPAVAKLPLVSFGHNMTVGALQRLEHRHLDLRRPKMQRNLRLRSRVGHAIRDELVGDDFVEVETPSLVRMTPEGAAEFLVPAQEPGRFFTLAQSPQQCKQLLMVAGFDKYFQFARCYRNEDCRANRQPEFTQVDLEMAFCDESHVMDVTERILLRAVDELEGDVRLVSNPPFPRLTYTEAMHRFGTDKPDLRYGMEIVNVPDGAEAPASVIVARDLARAWPSDDAAIEQLIAAATAPEAKGAVSLTTDVSADVRRELGADQDDVVFMAQGEHYAVLETLGRVRVACAAQLAQDGLLHLPTDSLHFAWITDFPLCELDKKGDIVPAHHPFTLPHPDDMDKLEEMLEEFTNNDRKPNARVRELMREVRGKSYDIVVNGEEIGGGSMRIHDTALQRRVLGLYAKRVTSLSHILRALSHGAPPHGGIALGFDRLMAVLCEVPVRDVMAFPKSNTGADPLLGAPSMVPAEVASELRKHLAAPAAEQRKKPKRKVETTGRKKGSA